MEITNYKELLSVYVSPITGKYKETDIKTLRDEANRVIKQFSNLSASSTNCQKLKDALDGIETELFGKPETLERNKLFDEVAERILTLLTGIEPVKVYERPSFDELVKRERDRQAVNKCVIDYLHPILTDKDTLQGYLRSIPNIKTMDFSTVMRAYLDDYKLLSKLVPLKIEDKTLGGYFDRVTILACIEYVFVQNHPI